MSDHAITTVQLLATNDEGRLTTDQYTKPTDTHQYLHCNSCHASHCKKAWPIVKPYG